MDFLHRLFMDNERSGYHEAKEVIIPLKRKQFYEPSHPTRSRRSPLVAHPPTRTFLLTVYSCIISYRRDRSSSFASIYSSSMYIPLSNSLLSLTKNLSPSSSPGNAVLRSTARSRNTFTDFDADPISDDPRRFIPPSMSMLSSFRIASCGMRDRRYMICEADSTASVSASWVRVVRAACTLASRDAGDKCARALFTAVKRSLTILTGSSDVELRSSSWNQQHIAARRAQSDSPRPLTTRHRNNHQCPRSKRPKPWSM